MTTYNETINGLNCIIEIQGGDESDRSKAENVISEYASKDMNLGMIEHKAWETVTEGWHDPNGFSVSIVESE